MSGCGCEKCSEGVPRGFSFQYAVKVVVGQIDKTDKIRPLPVGDYFTKVNIHNFSRCDCTTFRWKVAVGKPRLEVGTITDFSDVTICADEALEIVTADILAKLTVDLGLMGRVGPVDAGPKEVVPSVKKPKHIEGWVVIESDAELDVVAVYSTSAETGGTVNTFHTERVSSRCLPACEHFDLNISTGVAAWEVKPPGATSFDLATISSPNPAWAAALNGSRWVVPGNITDPGDYEYRLRFKLCSGFREPKLDLYLLADDYANVFVNNTKIPPVQTGGTMYTTATNYSATGAFKVGENELRIVVRNAGREKNPTGLDVVGSLVVQGGRCPGDAMPLLPCPQICYEVIDREMFWNPGGGFVSRDLQSSGLHCGGEGDAAGSSDGRRRMEQVRLLLSGSNPSVGTSIWYRVCVYEHGVLPTLPTTNWTDWEKLQGFAGPGGAVSPITAIEIRLVNSPVNCRVRYRVRYRNYVAFAGLNTTVSSWYYDGATAGSAGSSPPFPALMALEVEIV